MRWLVFWLGLSLLLGCAKKDLRYCDEDTECTLADYPYCDLDGELSGIKNNCIEEPAAPDGGLVDGAPGDGSMSTCEPSTIVCEDGQLVMCDSTGNVAVTEPCALDCHPTEDRCNAADPSNALASHLDAAASASDLSLNDGAIIDTSAESITNDGSLVAASTTLVASEPVDIFVVRVKSFTAGSVSVVGDRALAIVSDGPVVLYGHFSLSANLDENGPGAVLDCAGESGTASGGSKSGSGGGGFGGAGGNGGAADAFAGGAGSPTVGTAALEPLRGGCPGGHSAGGSYNEDPIFRDPGGGGGALQLVSATSITLSVGALISSNGGGAKGYTGEVRVLCLPEFSCSPGEGGGSGGAILLEAPLVVLDQTAGLYANGGGGSCGLTAFGSGQNGLLSTMRSSGADCASGSNGGRGGAAVGAATAGENGSGDYPHGGGGGGGVGRIRINLPIGSTFDPGGAILSPAPSVGTLATR